MTTNVCESHRLIETLYDVQLLESCPAFIASWHAHHSAAETKSADNDTELSLELFDAAQHKAEWTGTAGTPAYFPPPVETSPNTPEH